MGVGDLVGKDLDEMIGFADTGVRAQGLVDITARSGIGRDPCQDAAIVPNQPQPLRRRFQKIDDSPRIEDERIKHRHAGAALFAQFAAEKSEL